MLTAQTLQHIKTMTDKTDIHVKSRPKDKLNHVWWLPLIALLIVSFLGIKHFTSQGPLITIRFADAEGLTVKKTKVRYKDVDIGNVEKIDLDDNYQYVDVSIRMTQESEGLLRKNTKFWIVKPHIGITQISGLNTLLSGNYIAIDPDLSPDSEYTDDFVGLETAPVTTGNEPGLYLTLLASQAASLYPGTAVYYKGIKVGTVNRVYFSPDYLWVKADIFIAAPHDKLIQQTTKFWSTSGFSINTSANGLEVNMESVEALISGGITFDTPISLTHADEPVTNGTEYILHKNAKQAAEQNYGNKHYYITYFSSSVQGLAAGSPVVVQGIKVGKVKDIKIIYDSVTEKTQIPVLFEIYESRLGLNKQLKDTTATVENLIKDGLRAQLEIDNLLTGAKHISLTFIDDDTDTVEPVIIDEPSGYPIIPSAPESLNAITSGISSLVKKLNKLPLDNLANHVDELVVGVNQTVTQDLKKTITELNTLLAEGKTLSKTARSTLKQLNKSVKTLAKSAENTLSGYSPDAPLYYNLNATLTELNDTLRSLKQVSDTIDRTPNALIFGEKHPNDKK